MDMIVVMKASATADDVQRVVDRVGVVRDAVDELEDLAAVEIERRPLGDEQDLIAARRERQRIPLDQQFLSDLVEWREKLAKAVYKAHAELEPVVEAYQQYRRLLQDVEETRALLHDGTEDDVRELAEAELKDGVLTMKLPKAAPPEKKTKKLPVK